jgi:hypothetical protein
VTAANYVLNGGFEQSPQLAYWSFIAPGSPQVSNEYYNVGAGTTRSGVASGLAILQGTLIPQIIFIGTGYNRPAGSYFYSAYFSVNTYYGLSDGDHAVCDVSLLLGGTTYATITSVPAILPVSYQQISATIPATETSTLVEIQFSCNKNVLADALYIYVDDVSLVPLTQV